MTEKRFTLHKDYGIHDHLKSVIHDIETTNGVLDIIQELNILHYGIEECNRYMHRTDAEIHGLKKENHMLKQQLTDVDRLIDCKIAEYQKYDGYDTEKYYIGTQLLKELKKEFER